MVMDMETTLVLTQSDLENSKHDNLKDRSLETVYRATRRHLHRDPKNVCYGKTYVDAGPSFDEIDMHLELCKRNFSEEEYEKMHKLTIRSAVTYTLKLEGNQIELEIMHEKSKFPLTGLEMMGMYGFKITSQEPIETKKAA